MTLEAVFLYGSKARRDEGNESDTDLLGVVNGGSIRKPFDSKGISLHCYPIGWLTDSARNGSLFLLHIAEEAVPIFDPKHHLTDVREAFVYKENYDKDIEIGLRIIRALHWTTEEGFDEKYRNRYFWALRTAIMGAAANERRPSFSALSLEAFVGLDGLAQHIRSRKGESLQLCRQFGNEVLRKLANFAPAVIDSERRENMRALFKSRGVGTATARHIVYGL